MTEVAGRNLLAVALSGWLLSLGVLFGPVCSQAQAGEYLKEKQITGSVALLLATAAEETMQAQMQKRAPKLPFLPVEVSDAKNAVYVTLLKNGNLISGAYADSSRLPGNLSLAVRRAMEGAGKADLSDAAIVLNLLTEPVTVNPQQTPLPFLDPMIGTEAFRIRYQGRIKFVPPLQPLLKRQVWRDVLLEVIRELEPKTLPENPDAAEVLRNLLVGKELTVDRMDSIAVAKAKGLEPSVLFRCGRVVPVEEVTAERLDEALVLGLNWLAKSVRDDGRLRGVIEPVGALPDTLEPNLLEETLAAWSLAGIAEGLSKQSAQEMQLASQTARAVSTGILNRLAIDCYRENDDVGASYLKDGEEVATGPSAVAWLTAHALGLQRNPDGSDVTWQSRLERLKKFVLLQKRPEGRVQPYWMPPQKTTRQELQSGVGQLALLQMPDNSVSAEKLLSERVARFRYYDNWFQQQLRQPPYGLFAWQAACGKRLYALTRRQEMVDSPMRMAQLLVQACQVKGNREPDREGDFGSHAQNVVSSGVWLLGLADVVELSRQTGNKNAEAMLTNAMLLQARYALQLQVRGAYDGMFLQDAAEKTGAFRITADDLRIRQAWAAQNLAGLYRARQVLFP